MGAWANRRARRRLLGAAVLLACALLAGLSAGRSGVLAWSWPQWRRTTLVRLEGLVEALTADTVTVAGRELAWPADLSADLAVGEWVLVRAERDAAGRWTVRSLSQSEQGTPSLSERTALSLSKRAPVELEGTIEQLPVRDDAVGEWVVNGVLVVVEAGTIIHGQPAVGAEVEIRGEERGPGSALAAELWVLSAAEQAVVLEGRIASLAGPSAAAPGSLTLSAGKQPPYILVVDERTFIDESRGSAEVDSWAKVHAVPQPDGTLWVRYLRILRP